MIYTLFLYKFEIDTYTRYTITIVIMETSLDVKNSISDSNEVVTPIEIERNPIDVYEETSKSVCPKCLKLIDCQIIFKNNKVYMQKKCDEHGQFEVLVYSDVEDYLNAKKYNKPGSKPLHYQGSVINGCPQDCGLCEDHQQHSCVGIIEINDNCNLNCPVCFADSKGNFNLSFEKVKEMIDLYIKCEGEPEALQISGGEPTLHPEIIKILEYAGKKGIKYPMLNTNGIKLADRDFAESISKTMKDNDMPYGTPIIYLQFDGLDDEVYKKIRGTSLFEKKMKSIENCREFGMNVILVPTIIKGINEHEIGRIIDLAFKDKNIKGVNFQPSTTIGRYDIDSENNMRMTIPDVLKEIEIQSNGILSKKSFINIPCPYPTCSMVSYIYRKENESIVLTELFDMDDYMDYIVNRFLPSANITEEINDAIDSLLSMSAVGGSKKTENAICCSCGIRIPKIKKLLDNIKVISVHAFMDEHDFDLKRAKKCCVTEILPNGQMIPFCVYNIFYRKKLTPTFNGFC